MTIVNGAFALESVDKVKGSGELRMEKIGISWREDRVKIQVKRGHKLTEYRV